QTARAQGSREVPWSKLFGTEAFDVPNVKELVRDGAECSFVDTGFAERAGFDDLRGREMFHAVAGMIVGGVVDQERVLAEFRRAPHRNLGAHDTLDVFDE